jgi:hypothetical protein
MPSAAEIRELRGKTVTLRLTEAGGGGTVKGRVVGTLDAADGMVIFVEPPGEPGRRISCHHQHVEAVEVAG